MKRIFLLGGLLVILLAAGSFLYWRPFKVSLKFLTEEARAEDSNIMISKLADSWTNDAVVTLATTDEPSIWMRINNGTINESNISVYKADENVLLNFLVHDKEGKIINKQVDYKKLTLIKTFKPQSVESDDNKSKILLPLPGAGIFYMRVVWGDEIREVMIVRSGVGVVVKEAETEMIFWAQDLKTGRSIAKGKIRLFGLKDKKKELGSVSFNSQGLANIKMSDDYEVALIQAGSDISLLTINLSLGYGWNSNHYLIPPLTSNRFFTFTDRPIYKPGDIIYFKSIIRDDNDAVYHLASGQAIVELRYNWETTNMLPSQTFAINASGAIDGEFQLPASAPVGDYQLSIRTPDSKNPDNGSSDQVYFQVEQYRKPEYFLEVNTTKAMIIAGDQAEFKISGRYFFGQPLVNQKIKYTVTANYFWNDYYVDSQDVENNYYGYWNGDEVASGEVTLDKSGQATVTIDTKAKTDEERSTRIFSIETTYEDATGNSVLSRKNILVLKGEYQIKRLDISGYTGMVNEPYALNLGLKAIDNKDNANVELTAKISQENWQYKRKADGTYDAVHETNKLPEQKVKTDQSGKAQIKFTPTKNGSYDILITAVDQKGNIINYSFYAWVYQPGEMVYFDGKFEGLTIKTDKESYQPGETVDLSVISDLGERDVLLSLERGYARRWWVVKLNKGVTKISVPIVETDMPNIFAEIRAFTPRQKVTQIRSFGQNISVPADSQRLSLQIEADKLVYGPGETASLTVKALDNKNNPVATDLALWAVDKAIFELSDSNLGDIYNTYWFERYNGTQESNSLQSIFINSAERGCFTGDTPILMADGVRRAIADLKVGDEIMTKTSDQDTRLVKAKVIKTHSAEVPGYLIINGDLKLTPNHKLRVNNDWGVAVDIQIGDKLVGENNQTIEVKSIEWYLAKTKVYNIDVADYHTFIANGVWVHNDKGGGGGRSTFKDTAYWNASVRTDASGTAKVKVILPDNLTTWTIAAVAATGDTMVGQTTREIEVTKDVIVRPVLPNVMRVGDSITVSALVQNYTGKDREFNVGLDSENLDISIPYITKQIKSGGIEEIYWQVKPVKTAEAAKFKFFAYATDDQGQQDTITVTLPIWNFGFTEQTSEFGNGAKTFQIKLAPDAINDHSQIKLMLSSSLVGTLPAAMEYLLDYPYGCVEQTTSRFVPVVIARLNTNLFSQAIKDKDLDAMVIKGVNHLAELQNSSGAWGWWYDEENKPFISAYVLEYLLKARSTGIKIDNTVITRAQQYFTGSWGEDENNKPESIAKYYALGLLDTKAKFKFNFDLAQLTPDKLALAIMANYMAGNTDPATNGLSILESKADRRGGRASWASGDYDLFGSVDASTALAMRAIMFAHGNLDLVREGAHYLLENRQQSYWSNTFATAQIIQAVVDLHQIDKQVSANSSYQVLLNGVELATGRITDGSKPVEILISTSSLKFGAGTLEVKPSQDAVLYSNFMINEFRTDTKALALDKGLKVERQYIGPRGAGQPIAVGDRVTVVTTITGIKEGDRYVIVDDELPSGLIPINVNLKNNQNSSDGQRYFYYDVDYKLNGASMSVYYVYSGDTIFKYDARAVSSGIFQVPPVMASLMYAPATLGRSAAQSLEIITPDKLPAQTATILPKTTKKTLSAYWLWGVIGLAIVLVGALIIWFRRWWRRFRAYQSKQSQPNDDTTPTPDQDHYNQDKS